MRRSADIPELRGLVKTREELVLSGRRDADIRSSLRHRRLRRLRRDCYIDEAVWAELWTESQHLARVVAAADHMRGGSGVVSHTSALAVHGMPLYRHTPSAVHLTLANQMRMSSTARVIRHHDRLPDADITSIDGIRCTTLERTVFDVARILSTEVAVACADAALRKLATTVHDYDEDVAREWRERLRERAGARSGLRGVQQARWVIEFADGRAQLPGESVSRLQLARIGFARPRLQVPIPGPGETTYWVDFSLDDVRAIGEFDGKGKYLDPDMRDGRGVEEIMLDEKKREDWIRGRTQWRFARWGEEHIVTPESLATRLAAFGIRPPSA